MTATEVRDQRRADVLRRYGPYAVVLGVGALIVIGILLFANRQPHIWILPPLVLTGLLLTLLALSDRRRDDASARAAADRLGLRGTGAHPLPPLSPVLKAAEPANMLAGNLKDGGPLRVAHARTAKRGALTVAMTEIVAEDTLAADPFGVLGLESTAPEPLVAWVRGHELGLGLVAEGGTLVLAAPARRGEEPDFGPLIEAAAEARRRLA